MSRAFSLAGVAIGLVALTGTVDQARAEVLGPTMTKFVQKAGVIAGKAIEFVEEKLVEAAVTEGFKGVLGVDMHGTPVHRAGPLSDLKGVKSLDFKKLKAPAETPSTGGTQD